MIRGDHFNVLVTSNTREHLLAALTLAFADGEPATVYKIEPVRVGWGTDVKTAPALILARPWKDGEKKAAAKGWLPLLFPLDAEKAARLGSR